MAATVNTRQYEWTHGRKPAKPANQRPSMWAFQIDGDKDNPVMIRGTYMDAVSQARKLARVEITVLP